MNKELVLNAIIKDEKLIEDIERDHKNSGITARSDWLRWIVKRHLSQR